MHPQYPQLPANTPMNMQELEQKLAAAQTPVLLFFYTSSCGHCKPILPQLGGLQERLQQAGMPVTIAPIMIDHMAQHVTQAFQFQRVPTWVLFGAGSGVQPGQMIAIHEGPMQVPEAQRWAWSSVFGG
jgi:thioredoxin-like negative regulator of GroEL